MVCNTNESNAGISVQAPIRVTSARQLREPLYPSAAFGALVTSPWVFLRTTVRMNLNDKVSVYLAPFAHFQRCTTYAAVNVPVPHSNFIAFYSVLFTPGQDAEHKIGLRMTV